VGGSYCPAHAREGNARRYARRPPNRYGKGWKRLSALVIARDKYCQIQLLGCTGMATMADHVIPKARGGDDSLTNLQGACLSCNSKKGARSLYSVGSKQRGGGIVV